MKIIIEVSKQTLHEIKENEKMPVKYRDMILDGEPLSDYTDRLIEALAKAVFSTIKY